MKREHEKMLAGELYDADDPDLIESRMVARQRCRELNNSGPRETELRRRLLRELFGSGGDSVWVEPPFRCDYGQNIYLKDNVYFNFDCVILDVCPVRIGRHTIIAPGVHIYTAMHPLDAQQRRGREFGKPVSIGNDVWVGGRAVICPGVSVGDGAVIGAASVVTRDVPPGVIAAGNPARTLRPITASDASR